VTTFALSAPLTRDSPADEMDVVKVKKLLNRTLRSWSNAPDPGDDYHCRCWAEPVAQEKIDQLYADAIKPVYPGAARGTPAVPCPIAL